MLRLRYLGPTIIQVQVNVTINSIIDETKQELDRSFYCNSTRKTPMIYSIGKQRKMDNK